MKLTLESAPDKIGDPSPVVVVALGSVAFVLVAIYLAIAWTIEWHSARRVRRSVRRLP